jgi:hypothetical protein
MINNKATKEGTNMLFTVDLQMLNAPLFRLQKDGSWRKCEGDKSLCETDRTCETPAEVIRLSSTNGAVELHGTVYDIDAREWPTDNEQLHHGSQVFRQEFPKTPTKEQLKSVLANGDDSFHNQLILNVYGEFELRQNGSFSNDPSKVVRFETFCAGNGYVGQEMANNDSFLNDNFLSALDYWITHLKTGNSQAYCDLYRSDTLDQMLAELSDVEKKWKPAY